MHLPIISGVQQKNPNLIANKEKILTNKNLELDRARNSLLTLIEHKLAKLNETAIIVSDDEADEKLKELLFERTKWRYNPHTSKKALQDQNIVLNFNQILF